MSSISMKFALAMIAIAFINSNAGASSTFWAGGADCHIPFFHQVADTQYSGKGIENLDTTTSHASFVCPVPWAGADLPHPDTTSYPVTVYYIDNSSSYYLLCYSAGIDINGTMYFGTGQYACSTPGGCTTSQAFVGTGYLTVPSDVFAGSNAWIGLSVLCAVPEPSGGVTSSIVGYNFVAP